MDIRWFWKVQLKDGIYTDYLEQLKAREEVEAAKPVLQEPKEEKKVQKKKMSYMEKKEWETIEADIEQLEAEIETIENEMAAAGSDYDLLRELTAKLDEKNAEYEQRFERWSYLQQFQEDN